MDIYRLHSELARLRLTAGASSVLHEFVREFGATAGIFTSYVVGDPTLDSFRFVVAADSTLCDNYKKRFWFLNDPCIVYANSNTEPILASQLPLATAAQREIIDYFANYGFASGFVVPVHGSASSSRAGILFIGSSDPDKFRSRQALDRHRPIARLLAMELYDFVLANVRRDLLESADLSTDDLTLLRMQRDGYQSKDMAKLLNTTAAAVDTRFSRLNRKLGVSTRGMAAELLAHSGILS
jgi:DNA-binding CsgD family transcriptional regulator